MNLLALGLRSKAPSERPAEPDHLTLHSRLVRKVVQRCRVIAPIIKFSVPVFGGDVLPWEGHQRLYTTSRGWCRFRLPGDLFDFGDRVRPVARSRCFPGQSE